MKKTNALLYVVVCLIVSACAWAQSANSSIIFGASGPSGATVKSISVSVDNSTIIVGGSATFRAFLVMTDNSTNEEITGQCAWSSSDTTKFTMFLNVATGVAVGSASVSCSAGGLIGSLQLTVGNSPQINNPAAGCAVPCVLPQGTNGSAYNFPFGVQGGTPPYTWSITAGTFQTGLSLNAATGVLSGTPTVSNTQTVTVKVTDTASANASLQVTLTTVASSAGTIAALPLNWQDGLEWKPCLTSGGRVEYTYPASWAGGGPYTAFSQASLAQSLVDDETYRNAHPTNCIVEHIPHNAGVATNIFSGALGLTLAQTTGDTSTQFIVLISDLTPTYGQTVCALHGGVVDNGTNQAYNRNPGCATAKNNLWTIEYTGSAPGISAGLGADNSPAHHWAIVNAEVRPLACNPNVSGNCPTFGNSNQISPIKLSGVGATAITSTSQFHSHMHFYQDYVHGDWGASGPLGYPVGSNNIANAYDFQSCSNCSIEYGYSDQSLRPGLEGHGIQCFFCQTVKIVHNWFEGNSIHGLFCGGQSVNLLLTTVIGCTDIEDRGNRYTWDQSWLVAASVGNKPNGGSNSFVNKNAEELKNGLRVLRDGNIYENVDQTGAQNGTIFTAKVAQCSAGVKCDNYFLSLNDLNITNNVYRSACNGPTFGDAGNTIDGGGVSLGVARVNFAGNLGYAIGNLSRTWAYGNPECTGISPNFPYVIRTGNGDQTWVCTATSDGSSNVTLTCTGVPGAQQLNFSNGDHVYTSGCSDPTANTPAGLLGPAASGTSPSSLVLIYNNPGVTLNATGITGCVLHWIQGRTPNVTIAHNTAVGAGSGTGAYDLTYTNSTGQIQPYMPLATIKNNLLLAAWPNNNQTSGAGIYSVYGEGTKTLKQIWDSSTLTFTNNVISNRALKGTVNCVLATFTCTLAGGDAPNGQGGRMKGENVLINGSSFPVTAVSTTTITFSQGVNPGALTGATYLWADYTEFGGVNNGTQPPVTVFFPKNPYCLTNDPVVEDCAGVFGGMSSTTGYTALYQIGDWHNLRLCKSTDASCNSKASIFGAGQTDQASDGTDMGASTTAIDTAETQTLYVCGSACGTGPLPD